MKHILLGAAALSLLCAPAAWAQQHHGGGGHGGGGHGGGGHGGGSMAHHSVSVHRGGGAHRAAAHHVTVHHGSSRHVAHHTTARHTAVRHTTVRHNAVRHTTSRHTVVSHTSGRPGGHWRHVDRIGNRWGRGARLPVNYWRGHSWVDWRAHHLWAPPRGYNWVLVNGNYVLLAITTGIIADIVLANSYY